MVPTARTSDELATKAAAWAWYQHRIGSDQDKSWEEIRTRRIHQLPKPSRFKLEAMRIAAANVESLQQENSLSSVDTGILTSPNDHSDISLFDGYEIEMISKQFDSLIKHARDTYHHNHVPYINDHHQDPTRKTPVLQGNAISIKKSAKKTNGFWLVRPTKICGSSGDVVEPRRIAGNTGKGKNKLQLSSRTTSKRSFSGGPD